MLSANSEPNLQTEIFKKYVDCVTSSSRRQTYSTFPEQSGTTAM